MRVLIDTNVFISYLLSGHSNSPIHTIFAAWSDGKFTLLVSGELLDEILVTVKRKPRLARRISPTIVEAFVEELQSLGENIPRIESPIPAVTRDPKDDYLLADAFVGNTDYLVTGDKDLLALRNQINEFTILTPRQFSEIVGAVN